MVKTKLIKLTHDILYSYYTENKLDLFFQYLAEDILWLGAGRNMKSEGRREVCRYFTEGMAEMFVCDITDEAFAAMALNDTHYLIEETANITERKQGVLHECMHNSFIYRRTAKTPAGWEIVHLNNSITWKKLGDDALFAKKCLNLLLKLSKREYEIALMVSLGYTNKEIADKLNIAEVTVKKSVQQLFKKLSVESRIKLAVIISGDC